MGHRSVLLIHRLERNLEEERMRLEAREAFQGYGRPSTIKEGLSCRVKADEEKSDSAKLDFSYAG